MKSWTIVHAPAYVGDKEPWAALCPCSLESEGYYEWWTSNCWKCKDSIPKEIMKTRDFLNQLNKIYIK